MAAVIQINEIDEVLARLNYGNPNTLKYKLVHTVRRFYAGEDPSDFPKEINAAELVKILWDTGDDPDAVKSRKKNLSSTKSAVNADLKKLYQDGGNPGGIIIGRNNIFDLSDEAKNKALTQLADSLRGTKEGLIGKIAEVIETINSYLSNPDTLAEKDSDSGLKELDGMKQLVLDLCRKVGLSPGEMAGAGPASGTGSSPMKSGTGDAGSERIGTDGAPGGSPSEPAEFPGIESSAEPGTTKDAAELADESVDVIVSGVIEDYEMERARDAAWQGFAAEAAAEDDVFEDETPSQSVYESTGGADEFLEEIVEFDGQEGTGETGGDASGEAGSVGKSVPEPVRGDDLRETGFEGAAGDGGETDRPFDTAAPDLEVIDDVFEDDPVESAAVIPEDGTGEETAHGHETVRAGDGLGDGGLYPGMAQAEGPGAVESYAALQERLEAEAPSELEPQESEDILATPEEENLLEAADEIVEEVVDDILSDEPEDPIEEVVDEDLRSRAEYLSELAEAARLLEKIGPDFNDNIYSEEEIKEKAKTLSEEFERHLAIRDKYFNQHILIQKGVYPLGSREPKDHERPVQGISMQAFYVGKFPVTNALFELFIENTGYKTTAERYGYGLVYSSRGRKEKDPRTGRERFIWRNSQTFRRQEGACWYHPSGPGSSIHGKKRHPVVQVGLEDARAFAAWTGKRIPTENQWEASARTRFGYLYPWGNEWKDKACNVENSFIGDTTPVDRYPDSWNGAGLADTLGNVLEWTLDPWTDPATGEQDPQHYIAKGGSWASYGYLCLCSRFRVSKNTTSNILGFRCVAI